MFTVIQENVLCTGVPKNIEKLDSVNAYNN